ncbi:MAG: YkgJ family cysteine cluster protein [Candidatus Bathyarchaeota archaeon]|nr:YkgJ family cysteine cluster protein [Candidatus Termiticorpusculum sp.]
MRKPTLTEIYSQIPQKLDCRQCGGCCGNIIISKLEMQNIISFCEENKITFTRPAVFVDTVRGMVTFNIKPGSTCPLLSAEHKCLVYPVRPLICRLYGHAHGLDCPFVPLSMAEAKKQYVFTDSQVNRLLRQSREAWKT